MSAEFAPIWPPAAARGAVARFKWYVLAPTIACGALATAYAAVMPRYWQASQGLVVRQEAVGGADRRPGQFADLYEMRTLQETILELAKSRQVVEATLAAVDATMGAEAPAAKPTDEAVDEFRERLKMLPPGGAEFGKTEVFYFHVKDRDRRRAVLLVSELCRQLDSRLQELREERGRSLVAELEQQVLLAEEGHAVVTNSLEEFETSVGSDLGELRLLHSASSGQSDLRLQLVTLEGEARRYQAQARDAGQLLELLTAAQQNPAQLVTVPSSLLGSQPVLRRLKDGLVDAQLATARLRGTRSEDHPRVEAAIEAEARIRRDLRQELAAAIENAAADRALANQRQADVETQLADLQKRLTRLAEERAVYSNRVAAVDDSRETLNRARQKLNSARATAASAHTTSLVTPLDEPETGTHPEGPGRAMVAGAGWIGGFMLGLGVLMLAVGPTLGVPPTTASATAARQPSESQTSHNNQAHFPAGTPPEPASTLKETTCPAPRRAVAAVALQPPAKQPKASSSSAPPVVAVESESEWWEHPKISPTPAVQEASRPSPPAVEKPAFVESRPVAPAPPTPPPTPSPTLPLAATEVPSPVLPSPPGTLDSGASRAFAGQTLEQLVDALTESH